ncbi:uncharacterized protein LOC121110206 isoform X1 [Gallus gallus]|uniref:uncharacterized protein LOC121110206 isoform X1 n=1 Tax=Gallus gallus TaxID=9031 RepID=UPI001F012D62|nr:uncharacterized protein LOC121110206 isoform X1 [Gallus gallus]
MVALPRPGSPAPLPGLRRWAPRAPAVGRRRRGRACATWRRPETEPPSADRPQRTPGAPRRWLKPQRNRSDEGKPPYYGQWKRYGLRFVPHEAGLGLTAFKVPSILHLHRPCVAAACFPTWRLLLEDHHVLQTLKRTACHSVPGKQAVALQLQLSKMCQKKRSSLQRKPGVLQEKKIEKLDHL